MAAALNKKNARITKNVKACMNKTMEVVTSEIRMELAALISLLVLNGFLSDQQALMCFNFKDVLNFLPTITDTSKSATKKTMKVMKTVKKRPAAATTQRVMHK